MSIAVRFADNHRKKEKRWVQAYLHGKIEKNKSELIRMKYISPDFDDVVYEKEPQAAFVNAEIRAYTPAVQQPQSPGIDIGAVACFVVLCVVSYFCPPAAQTLQYQLGY